MYYWYIFVIFVQYFCLYLLKYYYQIWFLKMLFQQLHSLRMRIIIWICNPQQKNCYTFQDWNSNSPLTQIKKSYKWKRNSHNFFLFPNAHSSLYFHVIGHCYCKKYGLSVSHFEKITNVAHFEKITKILRKCCLLVPFNTSVLTLQNPCLSLSI